MGKVTTNILKEDYKAKYSTGRTLGQGAFGKVKMGTRKSDNLDVAIKFVNSSEWSERERAQFENEVNVLFELNHPNIVRLYEVYEFEPRHYAMVMELARGGELFDRIQAKGSFSESEAASVMRKLLGALAYMHKKKIAHRDLKPENIIYADASEESDVKLTDFGFAKKSLALGIDDENGGAATMLAPSSAAKGQAPPPGALKTRLGSPNYVAPEILASKTGYGVGVDIWSMGVILYILLCGYFPFYHENERELYRQIKAGKFEMPEEEWGSISKNAKDLIKQMLAVNPKRRISASDALRHPWLRPGAASGELLSDEALAAFSEFNKDRKRSFRGAVETITAALRVEKLETQMRSADNAGGLTPVAESASASEIQPAGVGDIATIAMQKARRAAAAKDEGGVYPVASVTFANELTGSTTRIPAPSDTTTEQQSRADKQESGGGATREKSSAKAGSSSKKKTASSESKPSCCVIS